MSDVDLVMADRCPLLSSCAIRRIEDEAAPKALHAGSL
eukprot:CAMPEP_0174380194 /NCGR_PEP_ID=MMETSP0811_2-20130205/123208_1 /TAXON_ID=73025 ORGANISM="Eutreptiella gymnastica-like, Strain CCMP1594" /NCGR_SAMPLE_ID=MMETSP0811_2 /ASSEMBLY_ACC=CAM_ASM_000667 /LENGTH=37 /DNA_ID= /DNA_START= /DNA_END= /DNA_ORIENTATION=